MINTFKIRKVACNLPDSCATQKQVLLDLCSEIENLRDRNEILEINNKCLKDIYQAECDHPKLLINKGKHGDITVLIPSEDDEGEAYLALFRHFDEIENFYCHRLCGDEIEAYAKARQGDWRSAKWLIQLRSDHEYEEVRVDWPYTPLSLKRMLDKRKQNDNAQS